MDRGLEQSGNAGGERGERRRGRRRVWWAVVVVAIAVMLGLGVGTCLYRMNWTWTARDSTGTTMTYFTIEKGSLVLFQTKMGWVTSDVPVRERRYNGAGTRGSSRRLASSGRRARTWTSSFRSPRRCLGARRRWLFWRLFWSTGGERRPGGVCAGIR